MSFVDGYFTGMTMMLVLLWIYGPTLILGFLLPALLSYLRLFGKKSAPLLLLTFVPWVLLSLVWAGAWGGYIFAGPDARFGIILSIGLLQVMFGLIFIAVAFAIRRLISPQYSWKLTL